jgi:hypothetical protein
MVKMCLAVAVLSRRKPTICVFALWVFANRIEFPGGWQAAGKVRLLWRGDSGSPESSQVVSLGGVSPKFNPGFSQFLGCFRPIYSGKYGGAENISRRYYRKKKVAASLF